MMPRPIAAVRRFKFLADQGSQFGSQATLIKTLGQDTNPLNTTATPGQWGGIEIRNDIDRAQGRLDREREGIFLNSIFQADIKFGGGRVGTGSQARPVSPIHLSEARPIIVGNSIYK